MKLKPIKLKFAGLQSYREKQEINFEIVGELGIFGIFGPTGAGKSTILDAITLALYGNVERAPGGIRGIMNHFEEELLVSFEFILGNDRYLAERRYRLNKANMGISNILARLIRITNDEEVLADKVNDMNNKVKELLGMDFQDFTRAVIIPQNKFDEFLKLTEGDRTIMLEKIFGLEKYGEKISKKVKSLGNSLDNEYKSNEKIMMELGDISDEVIKEVKLNLEKKQIEIKEKNKEKLELDKKIREMKELEDIYKEIEKYRMEKIKLDGKASEIKLDKEKLNNARKAEVFKEPLNQMEELKKNIGIEEKKYNILTIQQKEIDNEIKILEEKREKSKEKEELLKKLREEEVPKIKRAVEYEEEYTKLYKEIMDIDKVIDIENKKLIEMEKELKIQEQNLQKEEKELIELKKEKRRMENIFYFRGELEESLFILHKLETEKKQLKEISHDLKEKRNILKDQGEKIVKLIAKELNYKVDMNQEVKFEPYMKMADKMLEDVLEKENKLTNDLDNAMTKNMAIALALELKTGEPCQVCGSTHHPKIAKAKEKIEENTIEKLKKELKEIKDRADKLRKWQQDLNIQYNNYCNIKKELDDVYAIRFNKKNKELEDIRAEFNKSLYILQEKVNKFSQDYKVDNVEKLLYLQKRLKKAEKEYQEIAKTIENVEEKTRKTQDTMAKIKEEITILNSNIKFKKDINIRNKNILNEIVTNKRKLIGKLSSKEFEIQIKEKIEEIEKEIKEIETLSKDIKKKKEKNTQEIIGLRAGLERSKEHLQDIENKLEENLKNSGFINIKQAKENMMEIVRQNELEEKIQIYEKELNLVEKRLKDLEEVIKDNKFDSEEYAKTLDLYQKISLEYDEAIKIEGGLQNQYDELLKKQKRWEEIQEENKKIVHKIELVDKLFKLLRGRKFVKFLAEEHMRDMAMEASIQLGELTGQRYGLELDENGNFIMRDDYSNGEGRSVTTLSGGETFLTSLSLALALSSKIQLRGQPLGFFFLDEGFGTLDNEKLELVMNTLEKLKKDERIVGIISHVDELKNRIPRYIAVTPPKQNGVGSKAVVKYN